MKRYLQLQPDKYNMNHPQLSILFFFLSIGTLQGQSLHRDIQEIYNFQQHTITKEEQGQKAKLLDAFWEKVTMGKDLYLSELRKELADTTNPAFFSYDGGHLLLSLSQTQDDYRIAYHAMVRGDLKDIDGTDFVLTMNRFASQGINTIDAALKLVQADTFWAYIPQHALMLNKDLSLRFILLPISSDLYLNKLIDNLTLIKDTATIKNLLMFLDFTCTCKADSVILHYSSASDQDQGVREYAAALLGRNKATRRNNKDRYNELVEKRKVSLSRVSDEALDELDEETGRLKGNYDCR
ncbi:MAG: hypothetical protein ABI778_03595 [Ignavibacteriota bacterium]